MNRFAVLVVIAVLIAIGVGWLFMNKAEAQPCQPPYELVCYWHDGFQYCECM